MGEENRTERVVIYMSPTEKKMLEEIAKKNYLSVSTLLLREVMSSDTVRDVSKEFDDLILPDNEGD